MQNNQSLINRNRASCSVLVALIILGILARVTVIHNENMDTSVFLIPWYDYITSHGIAKAMGDIFANYTPFYTYLLALVTTIPIPKLIAIKLIPIVMDMLNSFVVYKIIKQKYKTGLAPLWACAIFWCLPTVILNSAFWGQADSLYTGFLLITLYYLIINRPFLAVVAFSVSISIKLQAIFMGPVLAIILLGCALKPIVFQSAAKIKLWYFLLVPIVYSVLCLPVVILGRQWSEVWSIYIAQAGTYQILSTNAPNPYFHIPNQYFDSVSKPGLIFASVCMFTWIVLTVNQEVKFTKERMVLAALVAVALAPYLLPKMHDRYFYPADLISFIVAFYLPRLWFLPILFQISSGLVYYRVLFKIVPHLGITIAVAINGILIAYLLWDQLFGKNRTIL